VFKGLN